MQDWDSFNMNTISQFAGIDVSKLTLDFCFLQLEAPRTGRVPNSEEGRAQLINQIPAPGACLIVVEATGGYEGFVAGFTSGLNFRSHRGRRGHRESEMTVNNSPSASGDLPTVLWP